MKIPSLVELTCRDVTELVTEYMHGALSVPECVRFEQHLHACSWCMTYLAQMQQTRECTQQLAAAAASTPPHAQLMEMFRKHKARP